jgi:hypothetical protein
MWPRLDDNGRFKLNRNHVLARSGVVVSFGDPLGVPPEDRKVAFAESGARAAPCSTGAIPMQRYRVSWAACPVSGGRPRARNCGIAASQVDRLRSGRGPRSCVGTRSGNRDPSASVPLAAARRCAVKSAGSCRRLRLYESHKSGGRPAPADVSAEYDYHFRAEEMLAVGLAIVARLVRFESHASTGAGACSPTRARVKRP